MSDIDRSAPGPLPPPGWYPSPTRPAQLQWWDGAAWYPLPADLVAVRDRRERRKPWRRFRVMWVIIALFAVLTALWVMIEFAHHPAAVTLAAIPAIILCTTLWWLDRLEPEPFDVRLLCFAWGAVVATTIAGFLNGAVSISAGDVASAVVSAPLSEEAMKGLLLVFLVHRRLIDSMIDGAVYVMTIAAGFAVIEDVSYFGLAAAQEGDALVWTVAARGLLTPFAHPLFSLPMGLAAAFIATRRPTATVGLAAAAGSYLLSVALHAAWNGTLTVSEDHLWPLFVVGAMFVALFSAAVVIVVVLRRNQRREFEEQLPQLTQLVTLTAPMIAVFSSTTAYLDFRRTLPRRDRIALGRLSWTLHALAAVQRLPARNERQSEADGLEVSDLVAEADNLRTYLFPVRVGY